MNSIAPPGWKRTTFRSICRSIVNGGTPDTGNPRYWDGTTPWVTGADFTPNGIGEIRRYVSDMGIRFSSTSVVRAGNLLLVTRTGVGKLAIAPCDIAISQDITGVYLKENEVDTGFVYFLMKRGVEELKKLNQGTSINGIIRSDLEKYAVSIPCALSEQREIAHVLSIIEIAIEKTESLIAKYQQIKAGLMHDLFTRGVTADGKLRPLREQAPELYQETSFGWIPKEWHTSGLRSKAIPGIPHLRTGPFGSALKGEHWVEVGHPVITIGALGEGVFIESELLYVGDFDARRLRDFQLKTDDVVFSRVADVGRSVVVRDEQADWIMSSNLMRIALDTKLVVPDFLQHLLSFDQRIKRQIRAKVNSGGRDVANSEILNQLIFAWPPYTEQQLIVQRAAATDSRLRSEVNKQRKLEKEKTGLMHDLLTGKVAVKVHGQENTI